MSADGKTVERRRSRRFPVAVPLEVGWRAKDGAAVKSDAVARQVNANGGFLKMTSYRDLGARVTLANFLSAQTAEARVLAGPPTREGVSNGIIVELIEPNADDSGASTYNPRKLPPSFTSSRRPCRTKASIFVCSRSIATPSSSFAPPRGSSSSFANATSAVQTILNCSLFSPPNGFAAPSIPSLALLVDLDAGRVKIESKEVDELYQALEQLTTRLRRDCQKTGDRLLNGSRKRAAVAAVPVARSSR